MVADLDLRTIYTQYAVRGGEAILPEALDEENAVRKGRLENLAKAKAVLEAGASPKEKMACILDPEIGLEIHRLRKSMVEPVIGNIKKIHGFRTSLCVVYSV